jgi:hypothetical protein
MASKPITYKEEYLELLNFILKNPKFSTKEITTQFIKPLETYNKEYNRDPKKNISRAKKDRYKDIKLMSDKIQLLAKYKFITLLKRESKGQGRSSIYKINMKGILDYFLENYLFLNLTESHRGIFIRSLKKDKRFKEWCKTFIHSKLKTCIRNYQNKSFIKKNIPENLNDVFKFILSNIIVSGFYIDYPK